MTNEERLNNALHELAQMFSQKRVTPVDRGQVAAARAVIDHCQWAMAFELEVERYKNALVVRSKKAEGSNDKPASLGSLVGVTAGPSQFPDTAAGDRLKAQEGV